MVEMIILLSIYTNYSITIIIDNYDCINNVFDVVLRHNISVSYKSLYSNANSCQIIALNYYLYQGNITSKMYENVYFSFQIYTLGLMPSS